MDCTLVAKSQSINEKILEAFLNDTAFGNAVVPGFYNDCDSLHIIDTLNVFPDKFSIKFSKIVLIERQYSKKPPFRKWYCNNLIVSIEGNKQQCYRLNYFHEPSSSAGFAIYKLKKGKLIKKKYQYGQY